VLVGCKVMKTVLATREFVEALSAICTLAGGRTAKPILNCVRVAAEADGVEVGASDSEVALRLRLPGVAVEVAGEAVVRADRLLAIARELLDVEIVLEADEKNCVVRGEGSEFRIYVSPPADFPPLPSFAEEADFIIAGEELRRMLAVTLYAAARETSRYAINGVLWQKQGKRLEVVATDGRRLARAGGQLRQAQAEDFEVIVPTKALSVFERVFTPPRNGEEWLVEVKVAPNQILLRAGERVLSSVLVEGRFPKYEDVIPKGTNKRARLDRAAFHGAVRRAALLTTEDSRAVRLAFSAERLEISAQSPEEGEAHVEIPIAYEGEPVDIGFNPAFLADALKVVGFDEVFFEMEESFRPGVLSGPDKRDFLYVVMPVSLGA
jgi:DNA polymerase-3 subunit beta